MSIKAFRWVKGEAPTNSTMEMCILYALAERADDDGTGPWPGYATLADEARCSRRTAMRHISNLESRGLIVREGQKMVAIYPADRFGGKRYRLSLTPAP